MQLGLKKWGFKETGFKTVNCLKTEAPYRKPYAVVDAEQITVSRRGFQLKEIERPWVAE